MVFDFHFYFDIYIFVLPVSRVETSSTMQNVIGPIRISHLYRTFFFFIFSWRFQQEIQKTSTSMLRDERETYMSCFSDGGGGYVNFCLAFAFRSFSQKI